MTHNRLATRKWKVRSDISESRSMMRLPSLSKSKSEVFGQSGHCSARLLAALCATCCRMQCSKQHLHSITLSARISTVGGMSRPSAVAVLRLITKSNLIGCSTGKSAGAAPFKILSTNVAALRNKSEMSAP